MAELNPSSHISQKKDELPQSLLIVEDDEFNQTLIRYWIQKFGYQFHLVSDAEQAFEHLKNQIYDLTLMDIQLPVMDGFQATQIIRSEIDPFMPILALTADELSEKLAGAMNHGMNGLVRKPFQQAHLKSEIEKAIYVREQERKKQITKSLDLLLGQSDLAFLKDLMEDFFSFQDRTNQALDEFILNHSLEKVTRMGHQLKSIALTIGAQDLAFYGRYFENLKENETQVICFSNRLMREYDLCIKEVRSYLSSSESL